MSFVYNFHTQEIKKQSINMWPDTSGVIFIQDDILVIADPMRWALAQVKFGIGAHCGTCSCFTVYSFSSH